MVKSLLKNLHTAWDILFAGRKKIIPIYLADLLFLTVFFASHVFIVRMLPALQAANEMIATYGPALSPAASGQAGLEFPLAAFRAAFSTVLVNAVLFAGSISAAWCIIQGFAWWRTHALAGNRISFSRYLIRFFLISAAWLAAVALAGYVALRISVFAAVTSLSGVPPWIGPALAGTFVAALSFAAVVGYALCATYTLAAMRLWRGMKRKSVPALLGAALVALAAFAAALVRGISEPLVVAEIFLVLAPSAAYARLLIITWAER